MIHCLLRVPTIFLQKFTTKFTFKLNAHSINAKFNVYVPSLDNIRPELHFLYDPLCSAHKLFRYLQHFHLVSLEFFHWLVSIDWWIQHQFWASFDMAIRIYQLLPTARSPRSAFSISAKWNNIFNSLILQWIFCEMKLSAKTSNWTINKHIDLI